MQNLAPDITPDTIAAIATPSGRGGVGIVRISGPLCTTIAQQILKCVPQPRQALLKPFHHPEGEIFDNGLALYFPQPNSFTGEDVLEFHGHGGPVVMEILLSAILKGGARMAFPGEFSQRAFLNGKVDLAQAEAIADLIDASTKQAALSASRSLQGAFSRCIDDIAQKILHLRMYVEAAIDFPDEEVDFLSQGKLNEKLTIILDSLALLKKQAKQGQLLKEGMTVVIVGQPNAGKSSLLNALTQHDTAIVTPIPGTTRDLIKETIQIDGMPVHIVDTAGIRLEADLVEQEGIRRAKEQLHLADRVLLVVDSSQTMFSDIEKGILQEFSDKVSVVMNKIDLQNLSPGERDNQIFISAKENLGIPELLEHLKRCMGFQIEAGIFTARRRHLNALDKTQAFCHQAMIQLVEFKAAELVAEELKAAQQALGEIVGKVTSDDLLGEIFSSFCIGK